jgi:3-amino-4-hydroxybenzoic acid synthase
MTIKEEATAKKLAWTKEKSAWAARRSGDGPVVSAASPGGETSWWCDCRNVSDVLLLQAVRESSCTHVVCNPDECDNVGGGKIVVVWVEQEEALDSLGSELAILTPVEQIYEAAKKRGREVGLYFKVDDLESQFPKCIELCDRGDPFVVIDIKHATYIPYELLVARVQGRRTKILRSIPIYDLQGVVQTIDQSLNAMATMEHGIGVLFHSFTEETVSNLSRRVMERQGRALSLVNVTVCAVQHTGLGHRVCVDTTSFMSAEEGMIIGSTGWGGIFVCSETHYLPHMNLREFRVNAGAVHSYIWSAGGSALYLSEMRAGSEVTCVDVSGNSRTVVVGRAKIERRPLVSITCRIPIEQVPEEIRKAAEPQKALQQQVTPDGERLAHRDLDYIYLNTFLQNDWHVRVMGSDGKIRHSTMLKVGDELLAHVDYPGRHTGVRIAESIIEK